MQHELVLQLATLAAQLQRGAVGFRQKDVRFLYEQLWNWQAASGAAPLHNTQILRSQAALVAAGLLRTRGRGRHPSYLLEPAGVFHLVRRTRDLALAGASPEFRLVAYFFTAYGDRIVALAKSSEMRALVDVVALTRNRVAQLEKETTYWKGRVREIREVAKSAKARLAKGEAPEAIIADIARDHPYELGYQKPLLEVFDETERPLMVWELVHGNGLRIELLWEPRIRMLETEIAVLKNR